MKESLKLYRCGENPYLECKSALRTVIRETDEEYFQATSKIRNQTLRNAVNSRAGRAVAGMAAGAGAFVSSAVIAAGFNNGSPMLLGVLGAAACSAYTIYQASNTKMLKGLVAGAQKLSAKLQNKMEQAKTMAERKRISSHTRKTLNNIEITRPGVDGKNTQKYTLREAKPQVGIKDIIRQKLAAAKQK